MFAAGDVERLRELIADYAIWHQPGRGPLAGDYKGPEEIIGLLQRLWERSEGTMRVELVDVLANAERVVAIHQVTAQRGGDELDVLDVVEFELHAGRITEATVYQSDTYRFEEFFA